MHAMDVDYKLVLNIKFYWWYSAGRQERYCNSGPDFGEVASLLSGWLQKCPETHSKEEQWFSDSLWKSGTNWDFDFLFVCFFFGLLLSKEGHKKPTDFRIFISKYMSINKGKFYSLASLEMSPIMNGNEWRLMAGKDTDCKWLVSTQP